MLISLLLMPFRLLGGFFRCAWGLTFGLVFLIIGMVFFGLFRFAIPLALVAVGIRMMLGAQQRRD